jgi:phosphatidylinositol-3-phosphatase
MDAQQRRRVFRLSVVAGILVVVTVLVLASLPVTAPRSAVPELPTPIQHVFLIMMENEETQLIYDHQPYETSLANTYAWGGEANASDGWTGYYAACHPSAPNYLVLTSGQSLQCGSDGYSTYGVNNLGNLLDANHDSWTAYEESATVPCQTYNNAYYLVRHDPFPYYADLAPNVTGGACDTHVLPLANLDADYPYNATPPAFTYIAPNILDDGHSSSATFGDLWLSTFIPTLITQRWFSSSVIFITYDEAYNPNGTPNDLGYDGLDGGPVYTVAVSPYTLGVGQLHTNSSPYNLLSTIEWLLHLPPTGSGQDGTANFPALTGLFQPRALGAGVAGHAIGLPPIDLTVTQLPIATIQFVSLSGARVPPRSMRRVAPARAGTLDSRSP